MKYVNDNFVKYMNEVPEYKASLDDMIEKVTPFMENFSDDPEKISQWGHYYFCDDDGGRLIFDLAKPHDHVCEVCGKTFKSDVLDGVWTYFYRNTAIVNMLASAAIYEATKEEKYLDYVKMIIAFYGKNYTNFKLHRKELDVYETVEEMGWGSARIMPQGLNESIIGIRVAQTYEIIKEYIDEETKEVIFNWFNEIYKILKPQTESIHNIRCWYCSVMGVMGLVNGNQEMLDFAFNSEFGMHNQLAEGVTEDGFWYEGSTHYNMFLLEGVSYLLVFAKLYGYDFGVKSTAIVEKMYNEIYHYAFDNDFFPNPNDGWPNLNLKTYSYQFDAMARVYGEDSIYGQILKYFESNPVERQTLPLSEPFYINNTHSIERLLFNIDFDFTKFTPVKKDTKCYEKSNYAMLRNDKFNVFMKYGLNAKSHAHPDIMNIEFTYNNVLVSRDPSNAGYRARLCNEWHRKTMAHNTVICNGVDITSFTPGTCVEYDANHVKATKADVYEGIGYTREIVMGESSLKDTFGVASEVENTCDFIQHFEAIFTAAANTSDVAVDFGYNANGYEHIINAKEVICENDKAVITLTAGDITCEYEVDAKGKKVYLLTTMDNPVNKTRSTVLVREIGKNVEFKSVINFK
ncbi:MAG: heparinase II/III family protein [Bacillota bacterium]